MRERILRARPLIRITLQQQAQQLARARPALTQRRTAWPHQALERPFVGWPIQSLLDGPAHAVPFRRQILRHDLVEDNADAPHVAGGTRGRRRCSRARRGECLALGRSVGLAADRMGRPARLTCAAKVCN